MANWWLWESNNFLQEQRDAVASIYLHTLLATLNNNKNNIINNIIKYINNKLIIINIVTILNIGLHVN